MASYPRDDTSDWWIFVQETGVTDPRVSILTIDIDGNRWICMIRGRDATLTISKHLVQPRDGDGTAGAFL